MNFQRFIPAAATGALPAAPVSPRRAAISAPSRSAVVADGFDGAALLGLLALGFLLRRAGLFAHERKAAVVVALEIVRRGFAAKVAVNALVINVILARHVVGIFVRYVSHKI
jgi:hypothetical protein